MKTHCLLLTSPFRPNIGGVETHLDDLITASAKKGVDFSIITYQPLVTPLKGLYKEKSSNYTVYRIPWPRLNLFLRLEKFPALEFLYLFPGLFLGGLIYLINNSKEVDVIHSQGLVAGAIGVFLGMIFNKKVIISTHSIYNFPETGFYNLFVKFLFNHSDFILTLSDQSKKEVLQLGIPESKVQRFTYWVDQKLFKPKEKKTARLKINIPRDKFVCLFVGRLVEVKGIRELLDASLITNKNIHFAVVGSGPLEEYVRKFASENKNVSFFGSVKNTKLPDFYNASDIVIIPSVHEEGFGRVILESLSCGKPVVGAKRGAIPEALTKDVGVLIEVSPENIKDSLEYLLTNPKKLKNLASKARKFAQEKYSEKNVDQIIRFYA